jgi:hypothetical protein
MVNSFWQRLWICRETDCMMMCLCNNASCFVFPGKQPVFRNDNRCLKLILSFCKHKLISKCMIMTHEVIFILASHGDVACLN